MFVSRGMMSIGMILIGLQFFLTEDLSQSFRDFYKDKVLFFLSCVFFIYLFSGFYSENIHKFLERMAVKLPFLIMPLGFSQLSELPKKYLKNVLYAFLVLCFITAVTSTGIYCMHYEEITESYKYARVLPNIFDISHTRLSLMLAFAVFASFYLFTEKHFLISVKEKYFIGFAGLFVFAFLHILSVRSGLLAFYITCLVLIISYTIQQKKYLAGIAMLALIILMPVLAYFTVPTIKNKISYMSTDISRFLKGESANHYSDGNRLLSIKTGIELGNSSPVFGIGIGDVEKEMFSYYEKNYPDISPENRLTPHNQFIYIYAACGLAGLLLFLIASFYPFILSNTYKSIVFLSINVIILTSYLSEATIENQLGVSLFVTFYLIGWYCKPDITPKIDS
jgi:O-antigen ligase